MKFPAIHIVVGIKYALILVPLLLVADIAPVGPALLVPQIAVLLLVKAVMTIIPALMILVLTVNAPSLQNVRHLNAVI
jgi:hypothetical protein